MSYFVTGGTGLVGRFLVQNLLERTGDIFLLVRPDSREKYREVLDWWEGDTDRITPVAGDITDAAVLHDDEARRTVVEETDHVFHLAAIYDMDADLATARSINVGGTENVVDLVGEMDEGTELHLASSIAVAGDYDGLFREDHFDEDQDFNNPYMKTKFESERLVREDCEHPYNVFRPGIVVGSSETGYIDKINGPYYFFELIQSIRDAAPRWLPMVGVEGESVQMAPVDYIADAIEHIALDAETDENTFHLAPADPPTIGEVIDEFFRAAKGPSLEMRVHKRLFNFLPSAVVDQIAALPAVQQVLDEVADSIGVPRDVLKNMDMAATLDTRNTERALEGTSLECPDLEDYAWKIWDYWERHLDPKLHYAENFEEVVDGKNVVVTGASSGIGRKVALRTGRAGGEVMLLARSEDDLREVKDEIEDGGEGAGHVYPCDLTVADDVDSTVESIVSEHGAVDILVNNAGHSIRRNAMHSLERFHDYERTMELNYFGSLRMIRNSIPSMIEQQEGHIINISSIGVLSRTPRFSAYVASKSALDAFSQCFAPEVIDSGVDITTVYMPLVRTPMIEPTKIYDFFPTLNPDEAADLVMQAMVDRPKRVATKLGTFAEVMRATVPNLTDSILNVAFRIFPSTDPKKDEESKEELSPEGVAFAHLMKGIHW